MDPIKQRIAIAEAEGIKFRVYGGDIEYFKVSTGKWCWTWKFDVPNYLNDRNAIVAAIEKVLTPKQRAKFAEELQNVTGRFLVGYVEGDYLDDLRKLTLLVLSEPEQLCEAFLRTIGKWEDGQ